jgi:hypothetical protein
VLILPKDYPKLKPDLRIGSTSFRRKIVKYCIRNISKSGLLKLLLQESSAHILDEQEHAPMEPIVGVPTRRSAQKKNVTILFATDFFSFFSIFMTGFMVFQLYLMYK